MACGTTLSSGLNSSNEPLPDDIGDRRFIPYIQLHEFEAILFSDPSWASDSATSATTSQIAALQIHSR